jgi:hypothetical protein
MKILLLLPLLFFGCASGESYLEIDAPAGETRIVCQEAPCLAKEITKEDFFKPVSDKEACTLIYGGPEKISLRVKRNGQEFSRQFNRLNSCETRRFDGLVRYLEETIYAKLH